MHANTRTHTNTRINNNLRQNICTDKGTYINRQNTQIIKKHSTKKKEKQAHKQIMENRNSKALTELNNS